MTALVEPGLASIMYLSAFRSTPNRRCLILWDSSLYDFYEGKVRFTRLWDLAGANTDPLDIDIAVPRSLDLFGIGSGLLDQRCPGLAWDHLTSDEVYEIPESV
ncbi:hypothetical protein WN48_09970 [Eufriesea mexicana]|uniref:Uncharacterized protein n=1 Tax=Eufriesea mexicana TaxID=516756 RepID=A0A310SGM7_9HYME|nr:hypothetical protein WN48_09970 [Eufriesea mexicana]